MPTPVGNGGRRRRNPKVKDPLHYEMVAGEVAASKELSVIMDAVRYSDFIDLDPPLPVDLFLRLRNVAMMKRFFSLDAYEMAARLGVEMRVFESLLAHPHYPTIEAALSAAAKRVAGLNTLDAVAKEAETRVAKEMLITGVTAPPSSREKHKALESLADRVSPKRSRAEGKGPAARVFPPDMIELIKLGLDLGRGIEQGRQRTALPAGERTDVTDVIDGETVADTPTDTPADTPEPAEPLEPAALSADDGTDGIDATVLNVPVASNRPPSGT